MERFRAPSDHVPPILSQSGLEGPGVVGYQEIRTGIQETRQDGIAYDLGPAVSSSNSDRNVREGFVILRNLGRREEAPGSHERSGILLNALSYRIFLTHHENRAFEILSRGIARTERRLKLLLSRQGGGEFVRGFQIGFDVGIFAV